MTSPLLVFLYIKLYFSFFINLIVSFRSYYITSNLMSMTEKIEKASRAKKFSHFFPFCFSSHPSSSSFIHPFEKRYFKTFDSLPFFFFHFIIINILPLFSILSCLSSSFQKKEMQTF